MWTQRNINQTFDGFYLLFFLQMNSFWLENVLSFVIWYFVLKDEPSETQIRAAVEWWRWKTCMEGCAFSSLRVCSEMILSRKCSSSECQCVLSPRSFCYSGVINCLAHAVQENWRCLYRYQGGRHLAWTDRHMDRGLMQAMVLLSSQETTSLQAQKTNFALLSFPFADSFSLSHRAVKFWWEVSVRRVNMREDMFIRQCIWVTE